MRTRLLALAMLAGLATALVAAAPAPARQIDTAKLSREIEAIVAAKGGPPGVAVMLQVPSGRRFLSAGVADTETGAAPKPNDHVRIASVAKAFSSYLAVKMAKFTPGFSLETTLGESIPGVLPQAEGVTVAQLLDHTSGLADYIRSPEIIAQLESDPAAYIAPSKLTAAVRDDPLEFRPGSRYNYSDTDNIAVGLAEQAASGQPYEGLLGKVAFGPLGMSSSSLPRTVRMPGPYMHGYEVAPGKPAEDVSELINPAGAWASGGIVSTPADLTRFVRAYVPTVLTAAREQPRPFRPGTSQPPGPGTNSAGIGIFRYESRCGTVYGHTGSFPGYRMFVAATANGSRSVVFAVNSQIIPGRGAPAVDRAIRSAQADAVCALLH